MRSLAQPCDTIIGLLNSLRRNEPAFIVMLFAVAFLAASVGISAVTGFNAAPTYDGVDYDRFAQQILRGEGYHTDLGPTSHKPPVYPVFLAALYWLAGESNYAIVRVAQAMMNSLTALLVYGAAKRLFGPPTAIGAGIGWALYPLTIYMSAQLYGEIPFVLMLTLFLSFLSRPLPDGVLVTVAVGLLAGLLLLVRPNTLVPLGLILAMYLLVIRSAGTLRRAVSLLMFASLVITPWSFRNYQVFDALVPLTTSGGVALWQGNNDHAEGGGTLVDANTWVGPDGPDRGFFGWSYLSEPESSARFMQAGIDWIRSNPMKFLQLIPKKVVRLWSPVAFTTQSSRSAPRVLPWVVIPPYLGLLGLAFWGMWKSRGNWKRYIPLYATIVGFTAVAMVFFGGTRYGIGMAPALLMFAAHGLVQVLRAMCSTYRVDPASVKLHQSIGAESAMSNDNQP